MVPIYGTVDPRFLRVKDAFASCFADCHETGANVAVVLDGRLVVNLWGGHSDKAKTRAWAEDTIVNVWSVTKGVVATAVAINVERGLLRYEDPIAKVWPGFEANGKAAITLNHVMSHTAGLNGFNAAIPEDAVQDWTRMCDALAAMAPNFPPGSTCAYHALTYGHLASEPVRRVSGKSIGTFIRDEIARPLGVEFFVGLPASEDNRRAEMIEGPGASDWVQWVLNSKYPQACLNPAPAATHPNIRSWRAAEIPGGNGHGTARALASIYGDLVRAAPKLMRHDTREEATRVRFRGLDESFGLDTVCGAGFRLEDPNAYGTRVSAKTIGHSGWGGSTAFGDPDARLGFAYVTNHMLGGFEDGIDPRRRRVQEALYDCLGK